jgi:hypothetical protein
MRTQIILTATGSLLICSLVACTPGPMDPESQPEGEPAAAGLPGEAIDPQFEYAEMPYDGNEDPGADIPGIDP